VNPRRITDPLVREAPILRSAEPIASAVPTLIHSGLPALPVAGENGRYCGIFGEREFIAAVFPAYLSQLRHAAFVPRSLEAALDKRTTCRHDPVAQHMNTEHIDVTADFSDAQVAEVFLHHRVLVLPVIDDGHIGGIITRADFFRAIANRVLHG